MNTKLKTLDFNTVTEFTANGKKYRKDTQLSFARYDYLAALICRLAYGRDFDSLDKALIKATDHLDKIRLVAASVELNNIREGIREFPNRINDGFAICALFLNYEGEDVGVITKEQVNTKIDDWSAEGLDAVPFMHLAASLSGHY